LAQGKLEACCTIPPTEFLPLREAKSYTRKVPSR
jgi:hypothetical protein